MSQPSEDAAESIAEAVSRVTAQDTARTMSQRSRLWNTWKRMIERCCNPKDTNYARYGGRGITVCARWRESSSAFFDDMGPKPSPDLTLDRIDNDGPYEPANCRWATRREQTRNKRTNVRLTHNGRTQCVVDWAREHGLDPKTLASRLKMGWSMERALSTPAGDDNASRERIPKTEYETIRALWRAGMRNIDIAKKYGVTQPLICRITRPIRRSA